LTLLAFAAGVIILQQFSSLPGPGLLAALALGAGGLLWRPLRLPGAFCAGLLWAACHGHWALAQRLPAELEGRDLVLEAEIVAVERRDDAAVSLLLQRARLPDYPAWRPRQLRLSWYGRMPPLQPGERWRLPVRLQRPHGAMNPAGFDSERWLFAQRIDALGHVTDADQTVRLGRRWSLHRVRDAIAREIAMHLQGRPAQGIVVALAVGERRWIERQQWEVLQATGTAHLVAISGLHVGLVALLTGLAVQRLWRLSATACRLWPARLPAVLAGMLAATVYALLAGFTLPTQRALIMLLVPALALLARRRIRAWHGFALALAAVLLWDPLAPLSAGFWLSFGAVLLLLAAGLDRSREHWLRQLVKTQLVASFGLLSVSVVWLQLAPWIAPLANAFAIPLVGFLVVPLTLIGTAGLAFGERAALPLDAAEWLTARLLEWLDVLAAHAPPAVAAGVPGWAVALSVLAALLLVLPRGTGLRWLSLPLLLPLALAAPSRSSEEVLRLTLFDVGHGTAVVLEAGGEAAVFDAGPRRGEHDAGERVLLPYLQSRGHRALRWLFVSHRDSSHSGGVAALTRHFPIAGMRVGEWLPELGEQPFCVAGERLLWQGVELEFLWPLRAGQGGDAGSCVLRIRAAGVTVLLTADIGAASERALLREHGGKLAADVLLVPRHGSRSASSEGFVKAVAPRHALVAAGYRNRYGLPHPEVQERYRAVGAALHETAEEGAIQLRVLRDGSIRLDSYRRQHGRYYHRKPKL